MTLALVLQLQPVVLGAITGLGYAVLAAGLVLAYRGTRVVNFAHGEIGALGAMVFARLVLDHDVPWIVALPIAAALGAAVGALWERTVIRRLFDHPRLIVLVATIGMAQLTFFARVSLPDLHNLGSGFPVGWHARWEVAGVTLRGDHALLLVGVPMLVGGLAWFLGRTTWGLCVRAAAENPDAARLAGVNVRRVSTTVWALGGALAVVSFVLLLPIRGVVLNGDSSALGPGLLMRALAVALVGRMSSLPKIVAGGVAFGALEGLLAANVADPGVIELCTFVAVAALLVLRGAGDGADDEDTGIGARPRAGGARPWASSTRRAVIAAGLGVAALVPFATSSAGRQYTITQVLVFVLIGLSVVVVTGWSGQLSLSQFAFVGIGAVGTAALCQRGMSFPAALGYAAVLGAAAALLIGLPALRLRGLFLSVITLSFSLVAANWLLIHPRLFGTTDGIAAVADRDVGPLDLTGGRAYYWFCLAVVSVVLLAVARLRTTGVGRRTIAVRDNEAAASAFTVPPTRVRLLSFALSGAIAALGGGLYAGLQPSFHASAFGVDQSLQVVSMAIIGGVGSVAGAVLGALYVVGLPVLLGDSIQVVALTSGGGLLVLLLFVPGGLIEVVERLVGLGSRLVGRGSLPDDTSPDVVTAPRPTVAGAVRRIERPDPLAAAAGDGWLRCSEVQVRFGGLVANRAVSLSVAPGEIVGLIGTNGSGKSTLMNAIGGFVPTSSGRVEVLGQDVTGWAPADRADLGMSRLFQSARLFPDLTVTETVQVALEARSKSELVPSLLGLRTSRDAERAKRSEAQELLDLVGLGLHRHRRIAELSTGTRRIVELACLMAVQARVLLLDEPTAGVAQAETEAFGPLIRSIRAELGACVLLVEHDMGLVMSLADRIYCMNAGDVIATGDPAAVRADPEVMSTYLGHRARTIHRSRTPDPEVTPR